MSKKRILFLCTGNSCRSQMAEGFAKNIYGDKYEVYSAGIVKHGMNKDAMKVMKEVDIDISLQYSKTVDEIEKKEFDFVITVCSDADQNCPFFPAKTKVVHKGFDDPPKLAKESKTEEEKLSHYRRVRDEIRVFIENLEDYL
jgi:arsenate reductase (thioredoxin)